MRSGAFVSSSSRAGSTCSYRRVDDRRRARAPDLAQRARPRGVPARWSSVRPEVLRLRPSGTCAGWRVSLEVEARTRSDHRGVTLHGTLDPAADQCPRRRIRSDDRQRAPGPAAPLLPHRGGQPRRLPGGPGPTTPASDAALLPDRLRCPHRLGGGRPGAAASRTVPPHRPISRSASPRAAPQQRPHHHRSPRSRR
jgi:hypothetical protein